MVLLGPGVLSPEDLRTLRQRYARQRKDEELLVLVNWRSSRGLRLPPLTCAVCNKRTFLGPLCYDHMEEARSMSRMWLEYTDPERRNVHKLEDFLAVQYVARHPERRNRLPPSAEKLYGEDIDGDFFEGSI